MAEVLVFPATNLVGFAQDNTGWHGLEKMPAVVSLTPGENYRVVWDGESFSCTARIVEDAWPGLVYLGDGSALNYPGNNEPFIVGWDEAADLNVFYSLTDTKEAHTVAIYHETSAEIGIIQYDRNGNLQEFYGKTVLRVDTTDGGTRDFVHANLVEKTVELDFSAGDMVVEPGMDEVFTKIIIPTPDNLAPENIPKDMNIAGIVGAMAGGGIAFAGGSIIGTGAPIELEHGLGVVPDVFFLDRPYSILSGKALQRSYSFSEKAVLAIGSNLSKYGQYYFYNTSFVGSGSYAKPLTATDKTQFVNSADSTKITVGTSDFPPLEGKEYLWFAIGGLT